MRPLLVALFLCLALAAPSAAGELRTAKSPIAGSYIVVFKDTAVRSPGERPSSQGVAADGIWLSAATPSVAQLCSGHPNSCGRCASRRNWPRFLEVHRWICVDGAHASLFIRANVPESER